LEAALDEICEEDEVIEIGVGSGFVSEKLKDKCKFLVATDISPYAVREAKKKGIEVIRTDLARGIKKRFSLVLFNPPYLELEEELKTGDWVDKAIDGGEKGVEIICRFLDYLDSLLNGKGKAILIVSSVNVPYVFDEIKKRGFRYEIVRQRRLFFEELFALKIMR
ncbi:protein methyltransferase, partial [Archaeoglobales archaeon]